MVTGEEGEGALTRGGLREYVADCVVQLRQEVSERLMTRSLRIAKYRGSAHGTNAYPFMIDGGGISVLPVTAVGLNYPTSTERISSGIPRLDDMLGDVDAEGGGPELVLVDAVVEKPLMLSAFTRVIKAVMQAS